MSHEKPKAQGDSAHPRRHKMPDIDESLFYDKYFCFKRQRTEELAVQAMGQLQDEAAAEGGGQEISIIEIMERMSLIQHRTYFCLNLDEEPAVKAVQEYYRHKYGAHAADICIEQMAVRDVGKDVVFKAKCITRGTIIDAWHHPNGEKVYEVQDKQGKNHTVPANWVVKFLPPPTTPEDPQQPTPAPVEAAIETDK